MKAFVNIILISVFAFLQSSCIDSLLDKKPESEYSTENFYTTPAQIKSALMGCYSQLQSAMKANFAYWGEGRADNVKIKHTGETSFLHNNNLDASLSSADWTALYTLISRANYVIRYIPNVFSSADTEGQRYMAEAKALRALAYFYLVRVWGDVPLITEPYTTADNGMFVTRTDKEKVLDFMVEELKYSATYCKAEPGGDNNRIMFTQGAANALLTHIYMWRKNYDEAIKAADLVLGNRLYSLVNTMADWSTMFSNGCSAESIFEVAYSDDQTNSLRVLYALGNDAQYTPSANFVASFENGDLRKEYIFNVTQAEPTMVWKFFGKDFNDESADKSKQNIILMRLADIMLLKAEALNKKGGTENVTAALKLLDPIRERAGLNPLTETEAISRYGSVEDAILHERSIELCFEGHRWFDLVRTGKAISTMQPINNLSDERNLLWPISTTSLNKNPQLEQNEYYRNK